MKEVETGLKLVNILFCVAVNSLCELKLFSLHRPRECEHQLNSSPELKYNKVAQNRIS